MVSVIVLRPWKSASICLKFDKCKAALAVRDFKALVEEKLGGICGKAMCVGDECVDDDTRSVEHYNFGHRPVWFLKQAKDREFQVFVMKLDRTKVTLDVKAWDTTKELKAQLHEKEGIPPDELRLVFEGKTLEDAEQTLTDYGVGDQATLYMVLRLRGGGAPVGFSFVDMEAQPRRRGWSASAPPWRAASPGFCVEGTCTSGACEAFGRRVIINRHMCAFDLVMDADKCRCPRCDAWVKPATCGFNNCEWRFTGLKVRREGEAPEEVGNAWTRAGNEYVFFDDASSGAVQWLRLKILTRRVGSGTCPLCLRTSAVGRPVADLPCEHFFHASCAQSWSEAAGACVSFSCPICKAVEEAKGDGLSDDVEINELDRLGGAKRRREQ